MAYKKIIAIDGPAGAGKSTIAKAVAKKLAYLYIDTGAMYRAIAWAALQKGVAADDTEALTDLAANCQICLADTPSGYKVYCDDTDISEAIRTPEVSAFASPVSAVAGVREYLVEQQQRLAQSGHVVMDGRDIGTKVLPQADCKIFLTADPAERARRRCLELQEKGIAAQVDQVEREIRERDLRDSTRVHSPLVQAKDAILIDSTHLDIEQVIAKVLAIAEADSLSAPVDCVRSQRP